MYFDTAYLAKCYFNEPEGREVRKLARGASGLYSSSLCIAEMACVFQRQIREGKIGVHEAAKWRALFLDDIRDGIWTLLPLSERLLHAVEAVAKSLPPSTYVRAGDAVHLVTAREAGFTEIWSNDRHLLAAAVYFGLGGKSV